MVPYTKRNSERAYRSCCKECKAENQRMARGKKSLESAKDAPTKVCKKCSEIKPVLDFPKHKVKGYDYYRANCKSCINAAAVEKRSASKPSVAPKKQELAPPPNAINAIDFAVSIQPKLFRYALFLHKCPHDAKDTIQKVFLYLLNNENSHVFTNVEKLKNFVYTAVKNEFLVSKRNQKYVLADDTGYFLDATNKKLQGVYASDKDLLSSAPKHLAKIIQLFYFGYTVYDIAKDLHAHPSFIRNCCKENEHIIRTLCQQNAATNA